MTDRPLRVWLEPGYDFGRFGAWLLDLPGCATWRDDRAAALASVPAAAASFGAWLVRHGERGPARAGPELVIVEEIPTTWVGEEEINPLFGPDRDALTADGLDLGIRRLDAARVDLLELLDRLGVPSTGAGGISRRGPDRTVERPALAVARHVGSAEVWLSGRLDRAARYHGPGPEDDLRAYLTATHAWAVALLRTVGEAEPARLVMDSRGEEWTPAKSVRRLVFHAMDHLGELARGTAA
ncbi:MAG TPA: DinB family protein [Candidatus Limnocylindrales bacterium]